MNYINRYIASFFLVISFYSPFCYTSEIPEFEYDHTQPQEREHVFYGYRERKHSLGAVTLQVAGIYALSWAIYPITQPTTFFEEGKWSAYKDNFGRLVWDKDEPFWNWMMHPISGSQLYLFYRAHGHTRWNSVGLTFISQALWEFTVETYTEPASFEDNYVTSVWGPILGYGLENLSMHLLNRGTPVAKFFGHLINPSTLFWFYNGKVHFIPDVDHRPGQERVSAFLIFEY